MNDRRKKGVIAILPVLLLMSVFDKAPQASELSAEDDGRALYQEKCGNCHGKKGEGFRRVYPPIRNSRYLRESLPDLPCVIRNGLEGEIMVAGRAFNQQMPGDPVITGQEMGLIIGFMLKEWGHRLPELEVEKWLERCPAQQKMEHRQ